MLHPSYMQYHNYLHWKIVWMDSSSILLIVKHSRKPVKSWFCDFLSTHMIIFFNIVDIMLWPTIDLNIIITKPTHHVGRNHYSLQFLLILCRPHYQYNLNHRFLFCSTGKAQGTISCITWKLFLNIYWFNNWFCLIQKIAIHSSFNQASAKWY